MKTAFPTTTVNLATTFGLSEDELFRQALVSFLLEKRREALQLKLEILARYRASSLDELEDKISRGEVPEHPAWEDLITAENLEARLEEINEHLGRLQGAEGHSTT